MINEIIKKYRKFNKMTQKDLGEILGYSPDTISLWEKGKIKPDYESIKKMCIVFNISADELLEIDTQEQKAKYINSFNNTTINNKGNIKF